MPYNRSQNSILALPDIYNPEDGDDEAADLHLRKWEAYKSNPMTCIEDDGGISCNGMPIPDTYCIGFASTRPPASPDAVIAAHPDEPPIRPEDDMGDNCICVSQGKNGKGGDLMINSNVDWRPDYVPESADPGAYSIKRAIMYEIGLMLGLRPSVPNNNDPIYSHGLHRNGAFAGQGMAPDIMTPVAGPDDNFSDLSNTHQNTYMQLVELYEMRHWDRGGLNDYTWGSGTYAGYFKSRDGSQEDWTKKVFLQNYTR